MTAQLGLSVAAIVIAIGSFTLSVYVAFRDRSRLKTESRVYQHGETGEYYSLYFKVVNAGRRPIIITLIEGRYESNHKCETFIDYENNGIKLEEGGFYEYRFGKYDGIMVCEPRADGDVFNLLDLWVIDSANRKYRIKNAKENIELLRASKHPLGVW